MKTLYRAAGRFTALKGTDRILHFIQALPNAIHASTDAYEVVLYRSLRRAVRDGTVTSVEPDGSSFYLLVASIFFRLITRKFRPVQRIRHLNAKLGAEFEGLKLFAETREINPVYFDPIFPSKQFCGDNAAMIAWAGIQRYNKKLFNVKDDIVRSRWPLDGNARFLKGPGLKL